VCPRDAGDPDFQLGAQGWAAYRTAAQTTALPGAADADESWLTVPAAWLETVAQAEPL